GRGGARRWTGEDLPPRPTPRGRRGGRGECPPRRSSRARTCSPHLTATRPQRSSRAAPNDRRAARTIRHRRWPYPSTATTKKPRIRILGTRTGGGGGLSKSPVSLRRPTSRADRPEAVQRSFRARRAIAVAQRLHRCWIEARKATYVAL